MRDRKAVLLLALLLGGCQRPAVDSGDIDAGNPLEVAARERGIVRPDAASPVGVFERTHELGRDAMCAVPDGAGQWRFAMTASFGPGLHCRAHGTIVRDGQDWRMRFAGGDGCEALVREEEDELRLPGNLPPQCANLCRERATLAGLRLPRASWSVDDAKHLRMSDKDGNIIRPCAG